jgi:hypothetical protein
MRWQEALKIKQNWTAEQARNNLERLIITGERPADKVVGLACQALEKQIPKKPAKKNPICYEKTKEGQKYYAYEYHCPMCDTKVNKEPHHCPCGQALDWSDTE